MFVYPEISPVLLKIGPLEVHWYGVMYLLGFLSAYLLARFRARRYQLPFSNEAISDVIFYGAVGVVVGGRLGYMLFYNFQTFIHKPLSLFAVWQGGMSFHGGLLGVLVGLFIFAKRYNKTFFEVTDFVAPLVPIGLALGRIGNFINGELWGRVTNMPWGVVFGHVDSLPRHPSQLYEFLLEGVLLFTVLWVYSTRPRPEKSTSALFLIVYGCCRFFIEFFREPDKGLGFIAFDWLTMGQLLSIPMILLGLALFIYSNRTCHKEAYQ